MSKELNKQFTWNGDISEIWIIKTNRTNFLGTGWNPIPYRCQYRCRIISQNLTFHFCRNWHMVVKFTQRCKGARKVFTGKGKQNGESGLSRTRISRAAAMRAVYSWKCAPLGTKWEVLEPVCLYSADFKQDCWETRREKESLFIDYGGTTGVSPQNAVKLDVGWTPTLSLFQKDRRTNLGNLWLKDRWHQK